MRKLSLKLDELVVESFPTTPKNEEDEGTVFAAEDATRTGQCASCNGGASCYTSCRAELAWQQQCTCPIPL